jgi:hypothetical protein
VSTPLSKRSLSVASDPASPTTRLAESMDDRKWHDRVAREALHQEVIEATFDRAEAYERQGDFERALESLDRAVALSGELPRAYRQQRQRCLQGASVRRASPAARGSTASGRRNTRPPR